MGAHFNGSLWPNCAIWSIDLRPLRLRLLSLFVSLLAHLRRTANTNAPNPWYEQSAVVNYHWFRVGSASECAEQALSERQPALLQSSDRPRAGLYGAQKWPLTAQLVENKAQGWSMYAFLFVWLVEWPVSCRYWPCTIVRVFTTPFHTKRATFFVFGARCGACSARTLGKVALNVHSLCMGR